ERSSEGGYHAVHRLPHQGLGGHEVRLAHVDRLQHVAVDVAVADVAERVQARAGWGARQFGSDALDQLRYFRYRYRDVVADRAPDLTLGGDDTLANAPQRIFLHCGRGNHRVVDQARLGRVLEKGLRDVVEGDDRRRGRELAEDVPVVTARERVVAAGNVGGGRLHGDIGDELEAAQLVAAHRARPRQQFGTVGKPREAGQHRDGPQGPRIEPEAGRGDDAEGALRAH